MKLSRRNLLGLLGLSAGSAPRLLAQAGAAGLPEIKLPLREGSTRFAVIGDNGTGEDREYMIAQQMQRFHDVVKYDFVVMNGDNIYGGHKPNDFVRKFEAPYKSLLDRGVKFYACLGNHDDADIERNYGHFNMGGQRYYTHTRGEIQFFVLDSNYMDTTQMGWLENELRSSKATWKIAYFHHPLFTAAKFHGPSLDLRAQLMPLFTKYGVNVVLYGHEHVYEHLKPQQGIYMFLVGNSGQLRYHNLHSHRDEDVVGIDDRHTFMLVEVSQNQFLFQTMDHTGQIVDAGVYNRQGT